MLDNALTHFSEFNAIIHWSKYKLAMKTNIQHILVSISDNFIVYIYSTLINLFFNLIF